MPLAVAEAANLYMVHTDHLGRPIRMTDSTKATVFQAIYKPYGEVYSTSGTKAQNLRFPGQYFQIETGFAYNWHRHYDPITGRYTQPDPLRFVDGPSVYSYVSGSPFIKTDREGLSIGPSDPVTSSPPTGGGGLGNPNGNQACTTSKTPSNLTQIAGTSLSGPANTGVWVSGSTWRYYGSDGNALFDVDSTGHGGPHIHYWGPGGRGGPMPY